MKFLYSRQAKKDLEKIDRKEARTILLRLQDWENGVVETPSPKMLVGIIPPQHRFRIGNYRIRGIFEEENFFVLRIRHRSDIYKDL